MTVGLEPSSTVDGRHVLTVKESVDGLDYLLVSEVHTFLFARLSLLVGSRWSIPWALTRPGAPQRLQTRRAGSILGRMTDLRGRSAGVSSRQE